MAVQIQNDHARSLGALLKDLAEGSTSLIKQEVRLARLEVAELVGGIASATAFTVGGAILLMLGGLTVLIGLILLGGDQWLRDRYWLAALIVFVVAGGLALAFKSFGAAMLSPKQLAPDQTVATLKEDTQWLKQRLT
jgi:uncharacterized membrane protein YqjE